MVPFVPYVVYTQRMEEKGNLMSLINLLDVSTNHVTWQYSLKFSTKAKERHISLQAQRCQQKRMLQNGK